jgi:adenylate cyclase
MLELVRERAVRRAVPHAWIAKWYVLRAQQGWSDDPDRDSRLAQDAAKRALDADPESSLALTIDGLVHTHMLKDHSKANQLYQLAVTSNPNNSLAWLLKGTEHAFTGNGPQAVDDTQLAIQLSPLDPHRYYYDTLAATAYLSNHQFELALASAERSLRANKSHTSTIRAKAIACWQLGRYEEAKLMGNTLMKLEPNLTITSWLARSPSNGYEIGNEWAEVLANVGVPK